MGELMTSLSRVLATLLLVALSPSALGQAQAPSPPVPVEGMGVTVEPMPAWVVPAPARADLPVDRASMHYVLVDDQVRLDGTATWYHSRAIAAVNDASGLDAASQIELDFDPSYQKLVFHHLVLTRGGQRIDKLDAQRVRFLQREPQLEKRMYDGRVTASIVLDDVRVGDRVELAYSVKGMNPVFEGRYSGQAWMVSMRGPAAEWRHRVLVPRGVNLQHRIGSRDIVLATRQLDGGVRELQFVRKAVPQFHYAPGTPALSGMRDVVQLSEYRDWAEVAQWGTRLFAEPDGATPKLDAKAAEIAGAAQGPEAQALAALNFVQTEVRYFGMELGANTHRPTPPEQVLAQRFGDCKDKTLLLVALLRRLGIEAQPGLVSLRYLEQSDQLLPSPMAFDHVIARVDVAGASYWLDGTRAHQTGALGARQAVTLGKALPLGKGTTAFAALPPARDVVRMSVLDTIRVGSFAQPPRLEARLTYRGDLAESVRAALATQARETMKAQLEEPYVRMYPKIRSLGAMRAEDVPGEDAVTLVQEFEVGNFWTFAEQQRLTAEVGLWSLADAMRVPNEQSRRDALGFIAGIYEHRIVLEYPDDVHVEPKKDRVSEGDRHVRYHADLETQRRRVSISGRVAYSGEEVAPAEWTAYAELARRAVNRMGFTPSVPGVPMARYGALDQAAEAAQRAVDSGSIKVHSKAQHSQLVRTVVLTEVIGGGRLTTAFKAEALAARGKAYDSLGRTDDARKDFIAALALAPDSADVLTAAGLNALARDDVRTALRHANKVLEAQPEHREARRVRAQARFASRDYKLARPDFEALAADFGYADRAYALVYLSLTLQGAGGDARQALASVTPADFSQDWPRPLVEWAMGTIDDDALLKSADSGSDRKRQLCEAYFYVAQRRAASKDVDGARAYLRRAREQGATEVIEHAAAGNELRRLAFKP
jgi:lipoprotein NlpI/transglutaminase-like putative cysteine protease